MEQQLLEKLIGWIGETAPTLWLVAKQAVLADTITALLALLFGIVLLGVGIAASKRVQKEWATMGAFPTATIVCVASLVFGVIVAPLAMAHLIRLLVAPDYSALMVLIELAKMVK